MHERDEIFRKQLIAVVSALNSGEGDYKQIRRVVGGVALKLFTDGGARDWADLKERATGPTYDSLLKLFQKQSEQASKAGDQAMVRAIEVLAVSLIARRQNQPDLVPGVEMLDKYIAECAANAKRRTLVLPKSPAGAR